MTGSEIVCYFFNRVIGSKILKLSDLENPYWDMNAAWLYNKIGIMADPFAKKLAVDIVKEVENHILDTGRMPLFELCSFPPPVTLAEYMKTHQASDREAIDRALAGTSELKGGDK